jgi:hypothetical protein
MNIRIHFFGVLLGDLLKAGHGLFIVPFGSLRLRKTVHRLWAGISLLREIQRTGGIGE